jgi:hypothetical protein
MTENTCPTCGWQYQRSDPLDIGDDCPLCTGGWDVWELQFSQLPLPDIGEQIASWLGQLPHPSALEIAGTERGLKLRLYAAPGSAQGAVQSWAAMTNQQTRWQRVECPPQRGAWRVLKIHARVPSMAVSPGDAFLAVGGQLLGQVQNGQETALRIWVLGRDDRLQERLRALASYA